MNTRTVPSSPPLSSLTDEQKRALLATLLQDARHHPVLSVTQERIWQLDQLAPGNPVYNFQSAIELRGPLDPGRLAQALSRIVARHETLRTRHGSAQGQPQLQVLPQLDVAIEPIDLGQVPPGSQAAEVQAIAQRAAKTGFALDQAPLFRLQCIRLATARHVLIVTMHHIVSDLLSLDLFFESLGRYYNALATGQPAAEAPLAWTYTDHARAEHARRAALRQGPAATFWREHLADAPELHWHSDFPRPPRPSGQAATQHFTLPGETVRAVESLARHHLVTPFVVLLAAFYALQHAASGSDDQLVSVPTAGRNSDEVQGLIGMFSSPLPMRVNLAGQPNLPTLLQRVRHTALGVTGHAALPFADIVDLTQTASGKPLVLRSMFSFVSRVKALEFAGLEVQRVPTDRGMSDFDLFLTIYPDAGDWRGVFEYSTDLFGASTARGWADAYAAIVRTMVSEVAPASSTDAALPPVPPTLVDLTALVPLPRRLQIAVAATFTAEILEEVGTLWQQELRWPTRLLFAPYNQVFQALMDPAGELHQAGNTLNVLLVRPQDWLRYSEDGAKHGTTLAEITGEFIAAVRQARLKAPLAIYLCPDSPGSHDAEATAAARRIDAELAGVPGVTVRRAEAALAGYGLAEIHDTQADDIGHIPFNRAWFAAMGTELVRRASSLQRPPYKVLALDCDNTLWRGVAAEEGAQGVSVDSPWRALQAFAAAQADAGMLLCLVSKNEPDDVFGVFEQNAGMLLTRDRIVAHRINWLSKSANLRALADELQLGLDSFIFIDDNPVECAEVQAACPEVLTLCLPQDVQAIPAFLDNVWAFDRHHVGAEDRQRADSYLQNRQRDSLRRQQGSFAEFLEKLELHVAVAPADEGNVARLSQLSQRTNQFNNGGQRSDESELHEAIRAGLQAHAVSVRDRFGDYGLVGSFGYRLQAGVLRVESFMLSCRVLGRGVEHRMLAELGRMAVAHGAVAVHLAFKVLPRNQPFRRFLDGLAGTFNGDGSEYLLSAEAAAATHFHPQDPPPDESAGPPATDMATTANDVQRVRHAAIAAIAHSLHDANAILDRLDASRPRRRGSPGSAPPQGETESAIAAAWQEVLHIDAPGRDDNFFDIGGNSLRLVEVNTRLMARLRRDVTIVSLFQFPTIASLAHHLDHADESSAHRTQVQARAGQARQQLAQRMQRLGNLRRA